VSFDAARVIADLRGLAELTGGPAGARRLCWTDECFRGIGRSACLSILEAAAGRVPLNVVNPAARLQSRFRAHGIRRGPRAKHRQARSGWDSLTPAETKIAALVQGGLSNPEIASRLFLSPRTVATHVSHILKKLDVHSRIDIAREAALRTIASR